MQDLDFYVTKNGRYIILENTIYDAVLDRRANINEISFSDLINIVGENVAFLVQDIKTDLKEISSFTRKNAYHVFECFTETDKRLSLMMEYEVKFGSSLLTESIANPTKIIVETWEWIKEQVIILEQTYNPFNKSFWSKSNAKQIGSNVGNAILDPIGTIKKAFNWIKENGLGALMEKIREGLYSGTGIAIQIFAQFTGFGNILVGIVWGAMLVYDLYLAFSGKEYSWLDILFDVLGIISAGALKGIQIGLKAIGVTKATPMVKGVEILATSPTTKGFMATIGKGISTVFGWIKKAGTWLSEKFGIKWVGNVLAKAEKWLSENLLRPIGNAVGLKNVGNKALSKGTGGPTVGQASRKAAIGGAKIKGINDYVLAPAYTGYQNLFKGKKPPTGLSDDAIDQINAVLA